MPTPEPPPGRLRVGHVTQGLDVGGQEKLLVEFARHAEREHFDLHFSRLGTQGPLAEPLQASGWPVTSLETPGGTSAAGWFFILHASFARPTGRGPHARRPAAHLWRPCGLAGARADRPAHAPSWPIASRFEASSLAHPPGRSLHRSLRLRLAGQRRFVEKLGVPADKVMTIWNGIDLDRFAYRGYCPGGPIVAVARLSPEKGLDVLLRAMAEVLRTEPRIRLEIAGDGPLRSDLEGLAAELHIQANVRFLGEISDVPSLLARASLFVLPSHSEGISLTLLEAMARGLPVVATKVGGNAEVVVNGETGFLVPPNDPSALAHRLRQVGMDSDRCQMFGRAGRRRVEAHFDIRRVLVEYEKLYHAPVLPGARSLL